MKLTSKNSVFNFKGLEYFGYDAETWVDSGAYIREQNVSGLTKPKANTQTLRYIFFHLIVMY